MEPENAKNTQIRFKYEYKYTKYTQKEKKYTNTKIQTHTNTNIAIGSLSQIGGVENSDFSAKSRLTKNFNSNLNLSFSMF